MSQLTADDILNNYGTTNIRILSSILLCGLAWTPLALTGLCPSFIITSPETSAFGSLSDEFRNESELVIESTTTMYMVGNMFGGLFIPPFADHFGRQPIFVITICLMALAGGLSSICSSITMLCVFRFMHGIFYTSSGLAGWVLAYENTPNRLRFFTSVYFGLTWVAGACFLAILAMILPDWRWLMFVISVPNILVAASIFFIVPESIHFVVSSRNMLKIDNWLVTVFGKAHKISSADVDLNAENHENSSASIGTLIKESMKHKIFLVYILVMTYIWIVDTFIYFGLAFYSKDFAGNFYLNFILMSLAEAPAYIIAPLFMNKYGRKSLIAGTHCIAGLAFIGIVVLPEYAHIHCWLLGKFAISCSFMSIYMFSSEIFPTNGRNKCIGFCETMSRIGGMLSPFIPHLTIISPMAPAMTLGLIAITGGALTLILPETLNTRLPSTIAETASRRQLLKLNDDND